MCSLSRRNAYLKKAANTTKPPNYEVKIVDDIGGFYIGKIVLVFSDKPKFRRKQVQVLGMNRLITQEGKELGHSIASCKGLGANFQLNPLVQ